MFTGGLAAARGPFACSRQPQLLVYPGALVADKFCQSSQQPADCLCSPVVSQVSFFEWWHWKWHNWRRTRLAIETFNGVISAFSAGQEEIIRGGYLRPPNSCSANPTFSPPILHTQSPTAPNRDISIVRAGSKNVFLGVQNDPRVELWALFGSSKARKVI
eukprot:1157328-Pelagomonas_calceolata.AAC.7